MASLTNTPLVSHEQCAVITCYCNTNVGLNTLVFSNGTTHEAGGFGAHVYPSVPVVVAEHSRITPAHKFFGVAIGAVDHNYVAVAISGVCTVACSHGDFVDSFPTDLVQMDRNGGKSTIGVSQSSRGPLTFDTVKLMSVTDSSQVIGTDVIGVLVAHGRNPADETKILLLPGLQHLPTAPGPATETTVCDTESDNSAMVLGKSAEAPSFATNPVEAVNAMTISQLNKVSMPSDLAFRQELGTFLEQVVDLARQYPNHFRTATE